MPPFDLERDARDYRLDPEHERLFPRPRVVVNYTDPEIAPVVIPTVEAEKCPQ